jgi:hypothetical protein
MPISPETGKQFSTTRKLGKTHQNILIFCKGDPRRATEACGIVEISDDIFEQALADSAEISAPSNEGEKPEDIGAQFGDPL